MIPLCRTRRNRKRKQAMRMIKRVMLALIAFYRKYMRHAPCCRFVPSCSQYAYEAIDKYGPIKGGYLAVRRILRCHPFYKGDLN
ncbi:MAG: membrane protein insertion efficiency factor YidD, partial [Loktanella sp.]|nr:membrane protein insertion efficiency factor YidD [Loktanella sp.]